jgi:hypothetical protein
MPLKPQAATEKLKLKLKKLEALQRNPRPRLSKTPNLALNPQVSCRGAPKR